MVLVLLNKLNYSRQQFLWLLMVYYIMNIAHTGQPLLVVQHHCHATAPTAPAACHTTIHAAPPLPLHLQLYNTTALISYSYIHGTSLAFCHVICFSTGTLACHQWTADNWVKSPLIVGSNHWLITIVILASLTCCLLTYIQLGQISTDTLDTVLPVLLVKFLFLLGPPAWSVTKKGR